MVTQEKTDHAKEQARAQLESIVEMVQALEKGEEIDGQDPQDRIQEDPLSVQVRSGWQNPGDGMMAAEYELLLCTGGPACRIVGDLDQYQQPETANLEYQDWFTPWVRYQTTLEENDAMLAYARQFYFGS